MKHGLGVEKEEASLQVFSGVKVPHALEFSESLPITAEEMTVLGCM